MGVFSFIKGVGEKIFGHDEAPANAAPPAASAQDIANALLKRVLDLGLGIDGLSVTYNTDTDTATVAGTAKTQADREKVILAIGNNSNVAKTVVDNITVDSGEPESQIYVVKSGDTLSHISKEFYGDANQYNKIFEANKPLLSSPDKIYPGQSLRIPA
ncbi:peptidoglycan-binding protein LysM [Aquirhabdus parva]|uniref:Potassium binding protein Kbp n=1 Tax=Aquirhabdus parva TaxID=2283318 RepID=A0A345P473_9GAMM|nr:peptidoglycan-binding protein LysM [Aquirhabdus parva]AXI02082.1 peptidoglycan-binding protein LysM [Aquirhabdus parva]